MNIALIGYGRMGKTIEKTAIERGHTIGLIIDQGDEITTEKVQKIDVAIEFTVPQAVKNNLSILSKNQIPTVCGTTGWLGEYEEVTAQFKVSGSFLYASNFSLGVNVFFELNKYLAKVMSKFDNYKVEMEEIHHTKKLDAPSGTAITLAEGVMANSNYSKWILDKTEEAQTIGIEAIRAIDVPGTHTVKYMSTIDNIEIKHTAHNRLGFALGAVVAAEYIHDKSGLFEMKDVLGL